MITIITFILWFIIALVFFCAALAIGRISKLRWSISVFFAMVIGGGTLGGLYIYQKSLRPYNITLKITAPNSLDIIKGDRVSITGTVSPSEALVTVVIRSEKAIGWWVQSIVHPKNDKGLIGHWSIKGYLGTKHEGINQNFYIIAIASADSLLFNLLTGRFVVANKFVKNIPPWTQSDPVLVRRVE